MTLRSSQEKTNGAKLSRLIVDGGTNAFRSVLDIIHPPARLPAVLKTHYSRLFKLKTRIINQTQWDLLYPPGRSPPDSSKFDVTLLFILLRNICNLHPPASGWDKKPSPTDESREADLARIKWYRNKVAHATTTGVDAPTFISYWTELSDALVRLGLPRSEIDRLECAPLDEDSYGRLLFEWKIQDDNIKEQLAVMQDNDKEREKQLMEISKKIDALHLSTEEKKIGSIRYRTSEANVLGKGSKGTKVYQGQWISSGGTGKSVAVKVMYTGVFDLREAKRLRKCRHPNIIQCFAVETKDDFIYLALELCKKTLRTCVEENDFHREDSGLDSLTCLKEITAAVVHLHERRICHRDIKPDNILLLESNPNRFVLADFNTAKDVTSGESASTQFGPVGTVGYMAPEMYSPGAGTTEKADLFSLGCVFYYTLANKGHPFGSVEDLKNCQASINRAQPPRLVESDFAEHSWVKPTIANMILQDGAERPSAVDVMQALERGCELSEPAATSPSIPDGSTTGEFGSFQAQEDTGPELIEIPDSLRGLVIGTRGSHLKRISKKTGARLFFENGEVFVTGSKASKQKAKLEIDRFLANYCFLDDFNLTRDPRLCFKPSIETGAQTRYRLDVLERQRKQSAEQRTANGQTYLDDLKAKVLQCLQGMKASVGSRQREFQDIWCHFGTVLLDVTEGSERFWSIDEAAEKLTKHHAVFSAGVGSFVVGPQLAIFLQKPLYETRHDLTFSSPSSRRLRCKVWVKDEHQEGDPHEMQDVLESFPMADDRCKGYLCYPMERLLKANIMFPGCAFDCRFTIRRGQEEERSPSEQQEDSALLEYLSHMRLKEGDAEELVLPDGALPSGWCMIYRRCCRRSVFTPFEDFVITVSKEIVYPSSGSEDRVMEQTDLHVHCKKWDRMLESGQWEPDQIANGLPEFLAVVRKVQELIMGD